MSNSSHPVEHVKCNFCRSDQHRVIATIRESEDPRQPPAWRGHAEIPVVRCKRCSLVFLNPRYDDARLAALYQDPQMFIGTIDPEGRSRSIVAERSQRVARFKGDVEALERHSKQGRLLDIGCGLGFFLEALGPAWEPVGLEWSGPVVKMVAETTSLRVEEDRFPSHPFPSGSFDVVSMHNLLDHLPDPIGGLRAANQLLKAGGLLMLSLVNSDSMCARVYKSGYRLLGPNHLYYFSPRTIRSFLFETGFEEVSVEFPYFGTEFFKPAHAVRIGRDAFRLLVWNRLARRSEVLLSPPFYGNIMRVFARRAGGAERTLP